MVVIKTGGIGSAVAKTIFPNTDGLTAGTTTQEGHNEHLVEDELLIDKRRDGVGLDGSR